MTVSKPNSMTDNNFFYWCDPPHGTKLGVGRGFGTLARSTMVGAEPKALWEALLSINSSQTLKNKGTKLALKLCL